MSSYDKISGRHLRSTLRTTIFQEHFALPTNLILLYIYTNFKFGQSQKPVLKNLENILKTLSHAICSRTKLS